jgi:hypothetical protein
MIQVYEMISSKSVRDMQMLLDWLQSPNNPYQEVKEKLKEYINTYPVYFTESETKEKDIYRKLLLTLQ